MIEVNNVSKDYKVKQESNKGFVNLFIPEYKKVNAVCKISFYIEKGEMVGLIGLNGAGKTTTLKMLAGLIHPSAGNITINGFTPKDLKKDFLKDIGLVMGNKSQLWWDISAQASFEFEGAIYGLKEKEIKERVSYLAEVLNVSDLLRTPVRKLSLGERMKMELILVLLHNPSIVFMDEPTLGLDIISQKSLRAFIKSYHKERKATMIITSHNMRDVEELCDRIIVLDNGLIIYDGSVDDIYSYTGVSKAKEVLSFEEIIAGLLESGESL
ncbi:MAG: ATP-binding cassette domain-containing protein [Finegoldia sp.]|nr:ATP-binding cassette domain-containing protein [Finegoldia sp.]